MASTFAVLLLLFIVVVLNGTRDKSEALNPTTYSDSDFRVMSAELTSSSTSESNPNIKTVTNPWAFRLYEDLVKFEIAGNVAAETREQYEAKDSLFRQQLRIIAPIATDSTKPLVEVYSLEGVYEVGKIIFEEGVSSYTIRFSAQEPATEPSSERSSDSAHDFIDRVSSHDRELKQTVAKSTPEVQRALTDPVGDAAPQQIMGGFATIDTLNDIYLKFLYGNVFRSLLAANLDKHFWEVTSEDLRDFLAINFGESNPRLTPESRFALRTTLEKIFHRQPDAFHVAYDSHKDQIALFSSDGQLILETLTPLIERPTKSPWHLLPLISAALLIWAWIAFSRPQSQQTL